MSTCASYGTRGFRVDFLGKASMSSCSLVHCTNVGTGARQHTCESHYRRRENGLDRHKIPYIRQCCTELCSPVCADCGMRACGDVPDLTYTWKNSPRHYTTAGMGVRFHNGESSRLPDGDDDLS